LRTAILYYYIFRLDSNPCFLLNNIYKSALFWAETDMRLFLKLRTRLVALSSDH